MNTGPLNQIHVTWPTEPQAHKASLVQSDQRGVMRTEIPYPAELGYGWVDQLTISSDLMVHQTVIRFSAQRKEPILPVAEFKLDFSGAALSVHTLHTGTVLSREFQPQVQLVMRPGQDLFRHCERGRFIPILDTSTDIVMTTLVCSDRALIDLIGEDAAQQLLQDLGVAESPQVRMLPIPLHVSEPLRECLSSGSSGLLQTLYAQSKILEYLWKLATFTRNAKTGARPGARGAGTIRALHDYLLNLEGEMPTLKELGQKFGESPQNLNRGFLREYGQSIFSMVTSHRLSQAHKALQEGNLPIKTIATRTGYSHVNHFTHAFKVRYGYTPGSLRRKPHDIRLELELEPERAQG